MAPKWVDGPFPLVETPEFCQKVMNKPAEEPTDQYIRGASIMAVVHNVIIRSLNTIYLQAHHVRPEDVKDFLGYCYCWYQYLDCHSLGEERFLFPKIEEVCGEKGLMDQNLEQHKEFESGIEAYKTYLVSLRNNESAFSPAKLLSIIDSFSTPLLAHLRDEISSLAALSRFGSSIPFLSISEVEMRKAARDAPKTEHLPFFFVNLDRTFEDGMWEHWPPIPGLLRWPLVRVLAWNHAGWWRFASCDYDGMPKELYATG